VLVPFTVDPEVLRDKNAGLDEMQHHASLIEMWGLFGQLVVPGNSESESELVAALKAAPQKVQTLWREAMKNYRKRGGNPLLEGALREDAVLSDESLCSGLRLVVLDRVRGELWGLPEDEYSALVARTVEICRFGHHGSTDVVKSVVALLQRPIALREKPDQVWRDRLKDLATASGVITVVDRYALKNFLESSNAISGLERLLRNLSGLDVPNKKIVNFYSAYSLGWDRGVKSRTFEAACKHIFGQLEEFCMSISHGAIREVNVFIAPEAKFGDVDHYRYIRFDNQTMLVFDSGLEPLAGTIVERTCPVTLVRWMCPEADAYRDDEKRLKSVMEQERRISCGSQH
jgi:hypothetical protein